MARQSAANRAITLRIHLLGSDPDIWRRVQVTGDMPLLKLHDVIQIAMGWTDSHLHEFIIDGEHYAVPLPGEDPDDDQLEFINERKVKVADVIRRKGQRFQYIYDFGDDWLHHLLVEAIEPVQPGQHYPLCLAGEGACPIEDSGGIHGYYDKLRIIKEPGHDWYPEIADWMPPDFDPDAFDLDETNAILRDFNNYISGWDRV